MNTATQPIAPTTTTVLYHGNCYDGFGAAYVAFLRYKNQAKYIPVFYGQPPPEIEPGHRVLIVDFSYPADILRAMAEKHEIVVLDHHATAEKDLSGLSIPNCSIIFDMTKSGCILAWEFLYPNAEIPRLLLYLQDRDLWKFELPNSRAVSAFLQTEPMDFLNWGHIAHEISDPIGLRSIVAAGSACLKLKEQMVKVMAENHRWVRFDLPVGVLDIGEERGIDRPEQGWIWAPCANATVFFSEVGEKLLEMHPGESLAAYYLDRKDGKRQWGLRSRPGFDCSEVAKAMGGGGHKQAAGFVKELKECLST